MSVWRYKHRDHLKADSCVYSKVTKHQWRFSATAQIETQMRNEWDLTSVCFAHRTTHDESGNCRRISWSKCSANQAICHGWLSRWVKLNSYFNGKCTFCMLHFQDGWVLQPQSSAEVEEKSERLSFNKFFVCFFFFFCNLLQGTWYLNKL